MDDARHGPARSGETREEVARERASEQGVALPLGWGIVTSVRRLAAITAASLLFAGSAFAQPEDDPSPVAPVPGAAAGADAAASEQPPTASPDVQPQVGMGTQKEEAAAPADAERTIDPAAEAEPDEIDEEKEADYGHGGQFGLRAGIVAGYRMVFRYDDSPYCKQPNPAENEPKDEQKFCGHQGPWAVDLGLSFAPLDGLEPYLWARFGIEGESQTNTNPVRILGAGLRVYTMADSQLKVFVSPAIAYEFEDGAGNAAWIDQQGNPFEYKQDVVFHLSAGPQFDFAPGFGAYFSAGMTVGILRYIHANLEGQLGVQIRIP